MEIDLKGKIEEKKSEKKKDKIKLIFKLAIVLFIFFFTSLAVFSSKVIVSDQSSESWFARLPIIRQFNHLAESSDRDLKGESSDRINILLLGMGGRGHAGGLLTDTIILASIEPTTNKMAMVSIPRDLAVPMEDKGWRKINHVNAYAEMERADSGGLAISQAISDVLNMPIDYYLRVDFQGFVNIVNELDGLEVNVENTLNDYRYPIAGREEDEDYESRFEYLHFKPGPQIMDGETALKYARSRHAAGIEGSDFARARRQQTIISAAKNKVLSSETLLNPSKLMALMVEFSDHVSTNIKVWEILKLWDNIKDIDKSNIINKVLDNSPNGLLVDKISEEGAYILTPASGDFAEIQYFVNNIFTDAPKEIKTRVTDERATIEVRNGTWLNGLASKTALDLEKYGFIVTRISNSSRQNFQKSVIYDLTYGEKDDSLTILKTRTSANVSFGMPDWLKEDIKKDLTNEINPIQPDFIIILGQNADETKSGAVNTENGETPLKEPKQAEEKKIEIIKDTENIVVEDEGEIEIIDNPDEDNNIPPPIN